MKSVTLALSALLLSVVATADAEIPYVVGDPIADFTLNDAYGTPVSLYDYQDKVILLNFWTPT